MGVSCSWWREMPVSGSEIVRGPGGGKDWTVPLSTVREGDGSPFLSRRGLFLVRGDVPGDKVSDELKGESLVTSSRSSCTLVIFFANILLLTGLTKVEVQLDPALIPFLSANIARCRTSWILKRGDPEGTRIAANFSGVSGT